jgi:16S rRNA (uracil1498-N3)-methyltransferase
MTAPFFLVEPAALPPTVGAVGAVVVIDGAEGRHAATVRRLDVGEVVRVGDGRGRVVEGPVLAVVGKDRVDVEVTAYAEAPPPSPRVVVVQALAKGDRSDLAVELATEVGADVVVPWAASRSVAVWRGDKADRGVEKWRATAREAAKQSRRPFVPEVRALGTTTDVAARIRAAVDRGGVAAVLHEAATSPLAELALPRSGDVVLVVGPEGGIAGDELELFADAGARAVRLGPTVMRTSTAGAVAAALVLQATGRWS